MRSIFTDEAPIPEITQDGMVALFIEASEHPRILVPREVVRRFCSDTLFLIDEWERKQAGRKPGNVCPFKGKRPGH